MSGPGFARCAVGFAFLACALLGGPASAQAVTSAQIVQVINTERAANGIPPVREDPRLSAGCAQYDNYRRMNGSLSNAFTPGREVAGKPGYTAAGAQASRDSLFNAGDRPADSWAAGDVFDDAPNHLRPLMDPSVAVVGADQLDFNLGIYGTTSLTCLDVRSAPGRKPPRRLHAYTYVGPNGKAPDHPTYREGPSGTGPFIFLYLTAPRRTTVTLRSLLWRRPNGTKVKPSFVAVFGRLRDGRRAHAADPLNAELFSPTVETRDDLPDTADDLDWAAGVMNSGAGPTIVTGQQPVLLQWIYR